MIDTHSTGSVLVIRLSGEIDLAVAPALTAVLASATEGDWQVIAVDCENLDFIDVAGTRPIARASREAARRGMRFYLLRPPRAATRVFELFELGECAMPQSQSVSVGFRHAETIEASVTGR